MEKRILIVDDEADLRMIIGEYFEKAGWTTVKAGNGKEALDLLKNFAPDVILSDINMPEMNGMELLETLFHRGSDIPLIFITGFRDVENMKKAWQFCAFDFLDKPFNEKVMILQAENAFENGKEYIRKARERFFKGKPGPL